MTSKHIFLGSGHEPDTVDIKLESMHDSGKGNYPVSHYPVTALSHEDDDEPLPYQMSWRTIVALIALNVAFAASVFSIVGPNSAIEYILPSFPGEEGSASWIANGPNFCMVSLPIILGSLSDRYGKKWFIVVGTIMCVVGSVISGSATGTLKKVIGGQVLTYAGNCGVLIAVPAMMKSVPAKRQGTVYGVSMLINTLLGSMGGTFVFAACVQHQLGGAQSGWRWAFYFQAMLFAGSGLAVALLFHPPPTRLQQNQSMRELLRSIDFVGIILLVTSVLLFTLALIWGGVTYPWNDGRVIGLLFASPVILVMFGLYEWKGRTDGLMNHEFFWTRNFPILLVFGVVDGMLLYSTSVFIPNQIRGVYTQVPLDVAVTFAPFQIALAVGSFLFGAVISQFKRFRLPLIVANIGATLFCGLVILAKPTNQGYFEAMIALVGFVTASTMVFPVAGLSAISPPYLTATSVTILACFRSLGGSLGVAIMSAVYNNKLAGYFTKRLVPILQSAKLPPPLQSTVIKVSTQAPHHLSHLPFLPPTLLSEVTEVVKYAQADSYKYIWVCLTAVAGGCFVFSLFMEDVPDRFTNHVESVLEPTQYRDNENGIGNGLFKQTKSSIQQS